MLDTLRHPRRELLSNIIREEPIPLFDWQGVPCKVCISVLKTELDLDCNNVKPRLDNENGWISMRNDF